MTEDEVREVRVTRLRGRRRPVVGPIEVLTGIGLATRRYPHAQMAHYDMQRHDWLESGRRAGVGGTGRQSTTVPVLMTGGTT
jgi:hypothetical protein